MTRYIYVDAACLAMDISSSLTASLSNLSPKFLLKPASLLFRHVSHPVSLQTSSSLAH